MSRMITALRYITLIIFKRFVQGFQSDIMEKAFLVCKNVKKYVQLISSRIQFSSKMRGWHVSVKLTWDGSTQPTSANGGKAKMGSGGTLIKRVQGVLMKNKHT